MKKRIPGGAFLVFEGIDGAGKSTQVQLAAEALERRGLEVVVTREPTDGPWGRLLRDSARGRRLSPEEELRAFLEDRREHVEKLIRPALAEGKVVISDRYYLSTVAYQGARGYDPEELLALNEAFAPPPDLAVVLDLIPELGIERIQQRGSRTSFEDLESLERCREIYRQIERSWILRMDGTRRPEEIRDEVLFILGRRLLERWAADPTLSAQDRLKAAVEFHGGDWR